MDRTRIEVAGTAPSAGSVAVMNNSLPPRRIGITGIVCFFLFGTAMSVVAAVMLLFPGSALEPLWRINPHAKSGFAALGSWAVLLMTIICVACATTAVGLAQRRRWGYVIALTILSINLVGDTINAAVTHDFRTLIGVPIGGGLIIYLVGQRSMFATRGQQRDSR